MQSKQTCLCLSRPMTTPRSKRWTAAFLLATFTVGSIGVPVLHHLEHAARWQAQATAHAHGDEASDAVRPACLEAPLDYQECPLCHRESLSFLLPELSPTHHLEADTLTLPRFRGAALPFFAYYATRAPPATA